MACGPRAKSIMQLDFERRVLTARLDYGRLDERDAQSVMRRIDDLDLAIAATPAEAIDELTVKIERLAAALGLDERNDRSSLEGVFIAAILNDARILAANDLSV